MLCYADVVFPVVCYERMNGSIFFVNGALPAVVHHDQVSLKIVENKRRVFLYHRFYMTDE